MRDLEAALGEVGAARGRRAAATPVNPKAGACPACQPGRAPLYGRFPRFRVVPWALRLSVRTSGFQPEKRGSNSPRACHFPALSRVQRRAKSTPIEGRACLGSALRADRYCRAPCRLAPARSRLPNRRAARASGPHAPTEVLRWKRLAARCASMSRSPTTTPSAITASCTATRCRTIAACCLIFRSRETASFWMRNTPSSLDIIFIGVDGRILNIADHTTPYSEAMIPSAGADARRAGNSRRTALRSWAFVQAIGCGIASSLASALRCASAHGRGRHSRGVAQPGRALALGAKGREFESRRPDQYANERRASGEARRCCLVLATLTDRVRRFRRNNGPTAGRRSSSGRCAHRTLAAVHGGCHFAATAFATAASIQRRPRRQWPRRCAARFAASPSRRVVRRSQRRPRRQAPRLSLRRVNIAGLRARRGQQRG